MKGILLDELLLKRFLASQGEWKAGLECVYVADGAAVGDPDAPDTRVASAMSEDDADYVAAVHNALPALITRITRAEADLAALRALLTRMVECMRDDDMPSPPGMIRLIAEAEQALEEHQ